MHDPSFVLFTLRRPVPTLRRLPKPATTKLGVITRFGRWSAYFPGEVTVWHDEPGGRDSGTVCGHGPGTGLTADALRWGWQHRAHLRAQVSAWQDLNRWLWSRCAGCGKSFRWGYSPVSHQWGGDGPAWRRPERNVFHFECDSADTWKSKATERLWLLGEVVPPEMADDLLRSFRGPSGPTTDTTEVATPEVAERWNKAWRVLYDLGNSRKAKADA